MFLSVFSLSFAVKPTTECWLWNVCATSMWSVQAPSLTLRAYGRRNFSWRRPSASVGSMWQTEIAAKNEKRMMTRGELKPNAKKTSKEFDRCLWNGTLCVHQWRWNGAQMTTTCVASTDDKRRQTRQSISTRLKFVAHATHTQCLKWVRRRFAFIQNRYAAVLVLRIYQYCCIRCVHMQSLSSSKYAIAESDSFIGLSGSDSVASIRRFYFVLFFYRRRSPLQFIWNILHLRTSFGLLFTHQTLNAFRTHFCATLNRRVTTNIDINVWLI